MYTNHSYIYIYTYTHTYIYIYTWIPKVTTNRAHAFRLVEVARRFAERHHLAPHLAERLKKRRGWGHEPTNQCFFSNEYNIVY